MDQAPKAKKRAAEEQAGPEGDETAGSADEKREVADQGLDASMDSSKTGGDVDMADEKSKGSTDANEPALESEKVKAVSSESGAGFEDARSGVGDSSVAETDLSRAESSAVALGLEAERAVVREAAPGREVGVQDSGISPPVVYMRAYQEQVASLEADPRVTGVMSAGVQYWLTDYFQRVTESPRTALWDAETYAATPWHVDGVPRKCWVRAVESGLIRVNLLPEGGVFFADSPCEPNGLDQPPKEWVPVKSVFPRPGQKGKKVTEDAKWVDAVNSREVYDRITRLNNRILKRGEAPPKPDGNMVDYIRRGDVLQPPAVAEWAPTAFLSLVEFGAWQRDELRRCAKLTFRAMPYELDGPASKGVKQWPTDALKAMVAGSFSLEWGGRLTSRRKGMSSGGRCAARCVARGCRV